MEKLNKSHLTAITRTKISCPIRHFTDKIIDCKGNKLDFGCGKGYDAEFFNMDKYDLYYYPDFPTKKYDLITCTYVLNVLENPEIEVPIVLNQIKELLSSNGKAFITVRRDIKKEGRTVKGTYQHMIYLPLEVYKSTSTFCTYVLTGE